MKVLWNSASGFAVLTGPQTFSGTQTFNDTILNNSSIITIKYNGVTKGLIGYRTDDLSGLQITGLNGSGGFQIIDSQTRWFTNGSSNGSVTLADNVGLSIGGIGNGRNLSVAGTTTATLGVIFGTYTVSTFPTTTNFLEAVVTDANLPVQGAIVAGFGSVRCKVMYYNGYKRVTAVLS